MSIGYDTAWYLVNASGAKRNTYRGLYSSYADADRAISAKCRKGFDHSAATDYFERESMVWNTQDYPVVAWMAKVLPRAARVFDHGGGLGQCYYAYEPYLRFGASMRWDVCDVEEMVRRGREIAEARGAEGLRFTTGFEEASGATLLLCSGTMQYLPEPLECMVEKLREKPRWLIVHRSPMYEGPSYYTVQQMQKFAHAAYHVRNEREVLGAFAQLGYSLVDSWDCAGRRLLLPFHHDKWVRKYRGFILALGDPKVAWSMINGVSAGA